MYCLSDICNSFGILLLFLTNTKDKQEQKRMLLLASQGNYNLKMVI